MKIVISTVALSSALIIGNQYIKWLAWRNGVVNVSASGAKQARSAIKTTEKASALSSIYNDVARAYISKYASGGKCRRNGAETRQ